MNHVLDGGLDPTCERVILRAKGGGPELARICPGVDILKATEQGQNRYGTDAAWHEVDGVHIGVTWRIRLNRHVRRPYAKLL